MSLSNLQSSVLSTIQESQLEDQYLSLAEELKVEQRRSEELVSENRVLSNDLLCANENVATLERKLACALNKSVVLSFHNTKLKEKNCSLEIELCELSETVAVLEVMKSIDQVGKDRRDSSKSKLKSYLRKLFGCFYL